MTQPGRNEMVAALGTVAGLTAYATTPDTPSAGAAWPAWVSTRWLNVHARESIWYAFVGLSGASAAAAVDGADPLVELVGQALESAGFGGIVAEPFVWTVGQTGETVPVLRFTAVS